MIQEIEIEHYKCFRNLKVPLKPFNVLVGPNNTGKSTFLNTLKGIGDFNGLNAKPLDYFRRDTSANPKIRITIAGESVELSKPHPSNPIARSQHTTALINQIGSIRYFDVPKLKLPMLSKGAEASTAVSQIVGDSGDNLAALLDFMLRKERQLFFDLIEALKTMIPGLEDLDIETPSAQSRLVNLVLDDGLKIHAAMASMGVRLMIFFAAFAFHPSPPKLLLIEEPETGVHPKRLAKIVELLRGISTGAMGRKPAQVILTTHSPYLLDCVDLETDNVLIFKREDDGARSAKSLNADRLKKYMDEYMLGEFWFNGGEDILTKDGV